MDQRPNRANLDTRSSGNDQRISRLVRLAARTFDLTSAQLLLIDQSKITAEASFGTNLSVPGVLFLNAVFAQAEPFVIEDATQHAFANGTTNRFMAGVRLSTPNGNPFGIILLLDTKPRAFTLDDRESLAAFGEQASLHFENEHKSAHLEHAQGELASALSRNEIGEQYFRAIFDNFPIGVLQLDPQMRFVRMNKAFLGFVGYTEDELKNMTIMDITHRDDLTMTSSAARLHVSAQTVVHRLEKRYVHKSGRILKVQVSFRALNLPGETNHCFFSAIEDLTEIRKREEQLHSAQTQLIESAKFASLGEMAGGIAHEINNPLAIIGARTEAMIDRLTEDEFDKERTLKDLKAIDTTVDRISKIIRGLQLFSRSSQNDPMTQSSVAQIIDQTQALCRERFKSAGVELRTCEVIDETIECRPTQVSQIILNLLGNAFDAISHLPAKWVQIDVERIGLEVAIRVTDSGSGIPSDVASKIMEPFFTTKEVGKGTGLGLSISRGIAETHGGTLKYDGNGSNTSFILILPIHQAKEVAKAA